MIIGWWRCCQNIWIHQSIPSDFQSIYFTTLVTLWQKSKWLIWWTEAVRWHKICLSESWCNTKCWRPTTLAGCMKLGELPTSSIWDARHPSQSTAIKKYAEDIHSGGQLYSWCLRYTRLFPIMFEHNSSKHALFDKNEWIGIVTVTKGVYRRKCKETQTWWSFYCNALVSIKLLIYLCYILKQTSVYFSPPFDWQL